MPLLSVSNSSEFPKMLLVLDLAGSKYLFADDGPLTISMDGADALFQPGLAQQDIEQSVELFGTSAQSKSVTVQVDLANVIELATLLSNGVALYATRASIYSYAGGTFETAQRIVSGFVKDPIYGDPAHPALFGFVIDRDFQERALIPSARSYADEYSFSIGAGEIDSDAVGAFYPIIIGKPGYAPDSLSGTLSTAPTVRAHIFSASAADNRIVVALGRVLATSIKLRASNSHSGTADIVYAVDDHGIGVSYADLSTFSGTASAISDNGPTWAAWASEGHPGITGGGFRGLGDVVAWALSQSSLNRTENLDWTRINGNIARLNLLGRIDTWIQGRIKPLNWLLSDVLAYFPVFLNDAGDGLYVDTWEYEATKSQAELFIDLSRPGFERCAPVSWSSDGTANVITIEGHLSAATGNYLRTMVWSGDPADLADDPGLITTSLKAVRSSKLLQQSFGLFDRFESVVSIPTVQDVATLDKLGAFYAYRDALPRAEVGYIIPWRKTIPRLGMAVCVNDAEMGLVDSMAILSGYKYTQGALQVRCSLLAA